MEAILPIADVDIVADTFFGGIINHPLSGMKNRDDEFLFLNVYRWDGKLRTSVRVLEIL